MIACEKTGRRARLIEPEPLYVDVAVQRWPDFTGGEATLDRGGRSFDELKASRARIAA